MQIIVLGMHRSGTSLVTRLINMMGAYFGPDSINVGAHKDNPKGFWERRDAMKINIEILKRANANWARLSEIDFSKISIDKQNDFTSRIKKIIPELDAHKPWIIKDPRLCMTFPFWEPFLEKPLIIYVHRDPIQIAQSLHTRNNFPINFSISLWEEYIETAFNAIKDIPKIILFHRDFFQDPIKTTLNLFQDLQKKGVIGLKMLSDKEINTFVDPKLYREKGDKRLQRKYISLAQGDLLKAIEEKKEDNIYKSINAFDPNERHLQLKAFENLIFSEESTGKPYSAINIQTMKNKTQREKEIIGHLGKISKTSVYGWASFLNDATPVEVKLFVNNKIVNSKLAKDFREGIKIKGIHPTGNCGFRFELDGDQVLNQNDKISIKAGKRNVELKGSPKKFDSEKIKELPKKKKIIANNLINISKKIIMGWSPKNRHISSFNFINRNKKIIMGWSPKAGCTVANKMFYESAGCLEEAFSYGQWIHNYDPIYSSQNPVTLKDIQREDFYRFKIVRNPFKRVISSYVHAMFTKYAKDDIKSVLKTDVPNNLTFLQFLDYLEKIDLSNTNPHHGLQKLVNAGEGTLYKYDYICKLEFLEEGVKVINKNSMADFKFKLEKNKLESHHHVTKIMSFNDSAYNKPFKEISSIKGEIKKVPDFKFFYNKEIIERVSELYKEDIAEYGYSYDLED